MARLLYDVKPEGITVTLRRGTWRAGVQYGAMLLVLHFAVAGGAVRGQDVSPHAHTDAPRNAGATASTVKAKEQARRRQAPKRIATEDAAHNNSSLTHVNFVDGVLSVQTENAGLDAVLKRVAMASGMTIDGSAGESRVYGTYGPGDPMEVLSALLAGSGCNFMLVGDTGVGAPRELVLTSRSSKDAPSPQIVQSQVAAPQRDGAYEEQAGPGAVLNVPPPPSDDPQIRMQQKMQRLQQMHTHQTEATAPP